MRGVPLVSTVKGLEQGSLLRMSEVIADEAGAAWPIVVLSGPTFAREFAAALPTAVSVASSDAAAAELVQAEFRSPTVRLYVTDDVVGVEMGGALKNVIAIAAGLVESLGLGHNAMAALVTRGLAEISRLAIALGGRRETLAGLSGLGDLVLTCTGELSRNRQVGIELGRGQSLDVHPRRHEDGGRRRAHRAGRARPRRPARRRAADHRADARGARRRQESRGRPSAIYACARSARARVGRADAPPNALPPARHRL